MTVQDITWKYKNLTISDNSHYAISKAAKVDGVVSSLTITGLSDGDFGPYKCVVNNGHGEDTHTVNLHRIGKTVCEARCSICVINNSLTRRLQHRADDLGEHHRGRPGHPQPPPHLPPVLPT